MKFTLILFFFAVPLLAKDICHDLADLSQKWPTYYNDIHLDQPFEELKCESAQYQIAKALDIIKSVDVPEVGGLYEYVTSSTPRLTVNMHKIYDDTIAVSIHHDIPHHKLGIELHHLFFNAGVNRKSNSIQDIMRAATLVHEARHMDQESMEHIFCTRGQLKGLQRCDERFISDWKTANAYSFEILFLKHFLKSHTHYAFGSDKSTVRLYIQTLMHNGLNSN